jgi:hypothetical protein
VKAAERTTERLALIDYPPMPGRSAGVSAEVGVAHGGAYRVRSVSSRREAKR